MSEPQAWANQNRARGQPPSLRASARRVECDSDLSLALVVWAIELRAFPPSDEGRGG